MDKTFRGKEYLKIGLHTHTTNSDGAYTPEQALTMYREAGYDAVALTDHWIYTPQANQNGLTVLSGCEYDIPYHHIVGIGMTRDPEISRTLQRDESLSVAEKAKVIVRRIREAGGFAVIAHPAWSVTSPERLRDIGDFDALEIYNSVSEAGMSYRPYSGIIVDILAADYGIYPPLLATDDTHYYNGDECRGIVMVERDAYEQLGLGRAIREKRFYATQGPALEVERTEDGSICAYCSPAVKVVFLSNVNWTAGRVVRGECITEVTYRPNPADTFVRVEITDADGRMAWSNMIQI
jgi:hypothetical protein